MSKALRATVAAEGGLLASALGPEPADGDLRPSEPAAVASRGPRTRDRAGDYALLVEAIHEGHGLHVGAPRVVTDAEPDLALLAGDRLYAIGLDRLAGLGDLEAVAELADVISLCALAGAHGHADLAEAAWEAGAAALGWGPSAAHRAAKEAARRCEPGAVEQLREAARTARGGLGAPSEGGTSRRPD